MTIREHLEAIIRDGDACYEGCKEHAVAALAILDAAERDGHAVITGPEHRLVPDPDAPA